MKNRAQVIRRDTLNALIYTFFALAALLLPELLLGSERNAISDNLSEVIRPRSITSTTRVSIQGSLTCDSGTSTGASSACSLKINDEGTTQLIQISGFLKKGIAERMIELYRTGKTTVKVEGDLSTDRRSIELSEVESL